VREIAEAKRAGAEVVVVTSGAAALGKRLLSGREVSADAARQVYSSVGQIPLMAEYGRLLKAEGLFSSQILVTKEDFRDRTHYANMKGCFENLLKAGIVPVVNENDPIAASGLSFTDNDELAGLIASQLNAEAIVILTSVDGVLKKDGTLVKEISAETAPEAEAHIFADTSATGRGGMRTKFGIGKKLMAQGIATHIVNGTKEGALLAALRGEEEGTRFTPEKKLSAIKRRLSHSEDFAAGSVVVNKGAEEILLSGASKSLLPVGVIALQGDFKKGDVIRIEGADGNKIGAGIAQYDAKAAEEAMGKKGGRALVHYDYLFIG
jgi:glutamate 5-kinase